MRRRGAERRQPAGPMAHARLDALQPGLVGLLAPVDPVEPLPLAQAQLIEPLQVLAVQLIDALHVPFVQLVEPLHDRVDRAEPSSHLPTAV